MRASTTAWWYQLTPSSDPCPWFQLTFQIWSHKCGGNSIVGAPYSHQLHTLFVKHLLHIWNGCGNHSMWDESHNHCMMVSFDSQQWSMITAYFQNPAPQVWWPLPNPQYTYFKWMLELFHEEWETQPLHDGIIWLPAVIHDFSWLSKSGPTKVLVTAWWGLHKPIQSI